MGLELKLNIDSVSEDAKSLSVSDATGVYSTENLTGYGVPNEARANLQVYLMAERVTSAERTTLLPAESSGDLPESANAWLIPIALDGVIEMLLVAAKALQLNNPHTNNEIVAYGGKLYKSLAAQTPLGVNELSDITKWKLIETIADFPSGEVNTGAYYKLTPYLFYHQTDLCRMNKTLSMSKAGVESMDFEHLAKEYLWPTLNMDAAIIAAGFGDFDEAGDALDEASQVCATTNLCGC